MYKRKSKRAESIKKQPFQLTNFSPFSSVASWTWRKCIRIIIQSNYFSALYAFVASFTWFFACCVHYSKFKRLITGFNSNYLAETLLTTFFGRANFNFFCNSCGWPSGGFFGRNKLSRPCISNSCRCFTHFEKF
jgi:hypothetical protein